MFFYKISGFIKNKSEVSDSDKTGKQKEIARTISGKSTLYNDKLNRNAYYFISDIADCALEGGILSQEGIRFLSGIKKYLETLGIEAEDLSVREITFGTMRHLLNHSWRNDFIASDDEILAAFDLNDFYRKLDYGEKILDSCTKKKIYEAAGQYLTARAMLPELDRIYASKGCVRGFGHPVHYMIETDDPDTRREICRTLLKALYANRRIQSRRYSFIDISDESTSLFHRSFEQLYKSNTGGSVIVRYTPSASEKEDDTASASRFIVEKLCEMIQKYQNSVLILIGLPKECTMIKQFFYEYLADLSFIELEDECISYEESKEFMKKLAEEKKLETDESLFERLEEGKNYFFSELKSFFQRWLNQKLKTYIYPQYKNVTAAKSEICERKPSGNAYQTLQEMIGLKNAKDVMQKALHYYKAQQLFLGRGHANPRPAMHMIFTGNSGTAKTTVARLFAEIMRDNRILSRGQMIECGRSELVGKFVGWTAPNIKRKFKEAEGGVLFIDEAYALLDDRNGSFGDEAIHAIVQEMENHREDVVVIFAGYPDKMEKFLQKNPGLRSRIAFHISFEDYTADELCEIALLMAKKRNLVFMPEALEKLRGMCETARTQVDFGNGRFVRNVMEQAIMAQSERLASMDYDSVKDSDLATLVADDIEEPALSPLPPKRKIGFMA